MRTRFFLQMILCLNLYGIAMWLVCSTNDPDSNFVYVELSLYSMNSTVLHSKNNLQMIWHHWTDSVVVL